MTSLPDEWRRPPPPVRLGGRRSIMSWIGPWHASEQLVDGLREAALTRPAQVRMQSRAWFRRNKARLGLFFRVAASAAVSFELARWLGLQVPAWAVITAIIVTQLSVGRSLQASLDYLAGTIGGAIYGAAVGVLLGGDSEVRLLRGSLSPWAARADRSHEAKLDGRADHCRHRAAFHTHACEPHPCGGGSRGLCRDHPLSLVRCSELAGVSFAVSSPSQRLLTWRAKRRRARSSASPTLRVSSRPA